jgi:hypothetical protein
MATPCQEGGAGCNQAPTEAKQGQLANPRQLAFRSSAHLRSGTCLDWSRATLAPRATTVS